jgi:hypothetical protein
MQAPHCKTKQQGPYMSGSSKIECINSLKLQLPQIEEILLELNEAKVFTTLDVKRGFWQLRLTEESSKLTTFWTPFGSTGHGFWRVESS